MSQSQQSPSSSLSFPQKLYMILENEVLYNNIIAWNKNGTSFQIRNTIRFEEEVIPRYFKHKKITSFQKQLNIYNFRSISKGEYKRSYYHPLFKRGDWIMVKNMTRHVSKGNKESISSTSSSVLSLPSSLSVPSLSSTSTSNKQVSCMNINLMIPSPSSSTTSYTTTNNTITTTSSNSNNNSSCCGTTCPFQQLLHIGTNSSSRRRTYDNFNCHYNSNNNNIINNNNNDNNNSSGSSSLYNSNFYIVPSTVQMIVPMDIECITGSDSTSYSTSDGHIDSYNNISSNDNNSNKIIYKNKEDYMTFCLYDEKLLLMNNNKTVDRYIQNKDSIDGSYCSYCSCSSSTIGSSSSSSSSSSSKSNNNNNNNASIISNQINCGDDDITNNHDSGGMIIMNNSSLTSECICLNQYKKLFLEYNNNDINKYYSHHHQQQHQLLLQLQQKEEISFLQQNNNIFNYMNVPNFRLYYDNDHDDKHLNSFQSSSSSLPFLTDQQIISSSDRSNLASTYIVSSSKQQHNNNNNNNNDNSRNSYNVVKVNVDTDFMEDGAHYSTDYIYNYDYQHRQQPRQYYYHTYCNDDYYHIDDHGTATIDSIASRNKHHNIHYNNNNNNDNNDDNINEPKSKLLIDCIDKSIFEYYYNNDDNMIDDFHNKGYNFYDDADEMIYKSINIITTLDKSCNNNDNKYDDDDDNNELLNDFLMLLND